MEEVYSPKRFALELGFSEAEADRFERLGANATNIRKVAIAKGMPSTKQTIAQPPKPKQHKHSYRKDGTCACGAVRKKPKQSRVAR